MSHTRAELIEAFVPNSPFAKHLGIELRELAPDTAMLVMTFSAELATMGDVVHGGAISSLIDTAGTVASWSDDAVPESPAGATVALAVQFLAAARGVDLIAAAAVTRRARRLCYSDVRVSTPDGTAIATGLVTYSFGG